MINNDLTTGLASKANINHLHQEYLKRENLCTQQTVLYSNFSNHVLNINVNQINSTENFLCNMYGEITPIVSINSLQGLYAIYIDGYFYPNSNVAENYYPIYWYISGLLVANNNNINTSTTLIPLSSNVEYNGYKDTSILSCAVYSMRLTNFNYQSNTIRIDINFIVKSKSESDHIIKKNNIVGPFIYAYPILKNPLS